VPRGATSAFTLPVVTPYRLDLTAVVLRRLATNAVDSLDEDRTYRRRLETDDGPLTLAVRQPAPDALHVAAKGSAAARERAPALVTRMLGTTIDVSAFLRASKRVVWLAPLAKRMRGVHPPRYPSLWEAFVNAIAFQQVSVLAASAILRRLVIELSPAVFEDGVELRAFPSPERVIAAGDDVLRGAGLSRAKTDAILMSAVTFVAGDIDESALEAASSAEAAKRLVALRGIGPWTAAVILLRGLGKLDVFPRNDSGVARSLALLTGEGDAAEIAAELGPQRAMLYFHFLLARLEARGDAPFCR
jgi:DNA-3-methyladenine glycosylase II